MEAGLWPCGVLASAVYTAGVRSHNQPQSQLLPAWEAQGHPALQGLLGQQDPRPFPSWCTGRASSLLPQPLPCLSLCPAPAPRWFLS